MGLCRSLKMLKDPAKIFTRVYLRKLFVNSSSNYFMCEVIILLYN